MCVLNSVWITQSLDKLTSLKPQIKMLFPRKPNIVPGLLPQLFTQLDRFGFKVTSREGAGVGRGAGGGEMSKTPV